MAPLPYFRPKNRSSIELPVLLVVGAIGAVVLFTALWGQPLLCPADTLVAGPIGSLGTFGALGTASTIFLLGLGFIAWRSDRLPIAEQRRWGWITIAALIATPLVGLIGLDGFFRYYCATPRSIVVHPDFSSEPITYAWADVITVHAGCTRGRGIGVRFRLELNDGREINMGGDTWSQTERHYFEVGVALQSSPYNYDNSFLADCPPNLYALFRRRPGPI